MSRRPARCRRRRRGATSSGRRHGCCTRARSPCSRRASSSAAVMPASPAPRMTTEAPFGSPSSLIGPRYGDSAANPRLVIAWYIAAPPAVAPMSSISLRLLRGGVVARSSFRPCVGDALSHCRWPCKVGSRVTTVHWISATSSELAAQPASRASSTLGRASGRASAPTSSQRLPNCAHENGSQRGRIASG